MGPYSVKGLAMSEVGYLLLGQERAGQQWLYPSTVTRHGHEYNDGDYDGDHSLVIVLKEQHFGTSLHGHNNHGQGLHALSPVTQVACHGQSLGGIC